MKTAMERIWVRQAEGLVLDFLVASAEKRMQFGIGLIVVMKDGKWLDHDDHRYSTDWGIGGPIIGRENILFHGEGEGNAFNAWIVEPYARAGGATHLIAGMRCYVIKEFGEYVNVPEVLVANSSS